MAGRSSSRAASSSERPAGGFYGNKIACLRWRRRQAWSLDDRLTRLHYSTEV
nr:MAG TPA: hypothetical protein [Caudoviricetes sp.]